MEDVMPIHGRGNFPTLDVKLRELVQAVREKLASEGVQVRDVRLNGGAASYILGSTSCQEFNDLDLIFGVDLINHNELQKIRNCVLECLLDFLPEGVSKEKMSSCSLKEAYVQKMVKVCNEHGDRWSLISLSNKTRKNVELKFVDKMKRQFEFSVDSFQVILDSLLTFYDISQAPMSEHFYPTVVAESVYGDFSEAWYHLSNKLIATRNPEEIRGGGLLKYCNLLVKNFLPAEDVDIRTMERYMCSRFFIDFSDINQQRQKLEAYLANHFGCDESTKYQYLMTLYQGRCVNNMYQGRCVNNMYHGRCVNNMYQGRCVNNMYQGRCVNNVYQGISVCNIRASQNEMRNSEIKEDEAPPHASLTCCQQPCEHLSLSLSLSLSILAPFLPLTI